MVIRQPLVVIGAAALLLSSSAPLFAQDEGYSAPPMPDPGFIERGREPERRESRPVPNRKMSDNEKREFETSGKLADGYVTGQPMPNDLKLAWARNDLIKATGNQQFIPFTVTIDPNLVNGRNVVIYWRVMKPAAAPAEGSNDKPAPQLIFQEVSMVQLQGSKNEPARLSRAFGVVDPGPYDVYVIVKEPTPNRAPRNAPPLKIAAIKQTLDVPNLWNDELNTSSVFVAQRIDPLPAPLTAQQQMERPYALGTIEIVPAVENRFGKEAHLNTFVIIYNPKTTSANKPDVMVEYNFYTKANGAEKFFNKTSPENWNAQTLPPDFDLVAGHLLQSSIQVPLASFPAGDYRLEIKITDKVANKTVTRDVNFSVIGS
jgi:hypothetical protein